MFQDMIAMGAGGASQVAYGAFPTLASNPNTTKNEIICGFKPKKLYLHSRFNGSQQWDENVFYDEDISPTEYKQYEGGTSSAIPSTPTTITIPNSNDGNGLKSIDANGFTMGANFISSGSNIVYMAVG